MEDMADFIGSLKWAQIRHLWFSGWVMLPYFVMLLCGAYALWKRNSRRAWIVTTISGAFTVFAMLLCNTSTSLPQWFVSTAGGSTSVVCYDGDKCYYISPLDGNLLSCAREHAEYTLENYLSRRHVDSLSVAKTHHSIGNDILWNDYMCNFGNTSIVCVGSDSISLRILADKSTRGADYLLVHAGYRGPVSDLVEELKPDTVLLASEMHWRRRNRWIDSMRVSAVPCIWLRHHRFGIRAVD